MRNPMNNQDIRSYIISDEESIYKIARDKNDQ